MRLIVGLSGPAQAGKDTVANHLVGNCEFTRLAIADVLREITDLYFNNKRAELSLLITDLIMKHCGNKPNTSGHYAAKIMGKIESLPKDLDDSNPPKPRQFMQGLGDTLKSVDRNILTKQLKYMIRKTGGHLVVPDIRFPSEANIIRRERGIMIRLDRKPHLKGNSGNHISEHAWKRIKFDYTLDSNGNVNALLQEAEALMKIIQPLYMEH